MVEMDSVGDDETKTEAFEVKLSPMQRRLMEVGGVAKAFSK